MCQAVSAGAAVAPATQNPQPCAAVAPATQNPQPSDGAALAPATENPQPSDLNKVDPYGGIGHMVDHDSDCPSEDYADEEELRMQEAKKKAKRDRMKFNRSLQSALPHIKVHA